MLKIIENDGSISTLKRYKYVFYFYDEKLGHMYAKISFKSLMQYVAHKFKTRKDRA